VITRYHQGSTKIDAAPVLDQKRDVRGFFDFPPADEDV
jgi:hypothetical protein